MNYYINDVVLKYHLIIDINKRVKYVYKSQMNLIEIIYIILKSFKNTQKHLFLFVVVVNIVIYNPFLCASKLTPPGPKATINNKPPTTDKV